MLVDLASEIRLSGYNPQVIVGVSRGGWPPARVMSDLLENPNLANMRVEFYKNIGVTAKRPKISQPVTSEVSGKRVLVVDDVSDSGHSLRVASKQGRTGDQGLYSIFEAKERLQTKPLCKNNLKVGDLSMGKIGGHQPHQKEPPVRWRNIRDNSGAERQWIEWPAH